MTSRRIFLHVGLPKTGTTYLQTALWDGKERLLERGVLVPGRHQRRHLLASLDLREDPKLKRRSGDVEHPWQDLVVEAGKHDGDVMISHEFFAAAAPHQIQRAVESFPDAELHVIITARPMVDLALSRWQEWVRNGGKRGVDGYPPQPHYDPVDEWGWGSFDLGDVLERWRIALPEERIHVLPIDPNASDPNDLLGRFLSVLELPVSAVSPPAERVNESLGLVEIELLRRITPHMDGFRSAGDRGRWIRGFLAAPHRMGEGREKFRPNAEVLADLEVRADRAQKMLAEGDFDIVGDIEWLASPDVSSRRHPRDVEDSEMLESATRLIAALMTDVREVTRERNALNKKLRRADRHRTRLGKVIDRLRED